MDAAKKIILFVALVMVCAVTASASIPRTPENRVGEIFAPSAKAHRFESLQLHQSQWDAQAFSLQIALDLTIDADGRFGKGVSEGFGGRTSASSPNSWAYGAGQMLGGVTSGYYSGLGEGASNVSGYTALQANLEYYGGDYYQSINMTYNPIAIGSVKYAEAFGGTGYSYDNSGQSLNASERLMSFGVGTLNFAAVVGPLEASVNAYSSSLSASLRTPPLPPRAIVRHGPMNPGPLADDIANTFRSGSYTARTLDQPTTLYRVIGDTGNPAGSYWTATRPQGPLQSVIDLALDQNWGNTATTVIRAQVPAGTRIYEGAAAAQRGLVGGGNQIYIPQVNPGWIQP